MDSAAIELDNNDNEGDGDIDMSDETAAMSSFSYQTLRPNNQNHNHNHNHQHGSDGKRKHSVANKGVAHDDNGVFTRENDDDRKRSFSTAPHSAKRQKLTSTRPAKPSEQSENVQRLSKTVNRYFWNENNIDQHQWIRVIRNAFPQTVRVWIDMSRDLSEMNIEHYQYSTALDYIKCQFFLSSMSLFHSKHFQSHEQSSPTIPSPVVTAQRDHTTFFPTIHSSSNNSDVKQSISDPPGPKTMKKSWLDPTSVRHRQQQQQQLQYQSKFMVPTNTSDYAAVAQQGLLLTFRLFLHMGLNPVTTPIPHFLDMVHQQHSTPRKSKAQQHQNGTSKFKPVQLSKSHASDDVDDHNPTNNQHNAQDLYAPDFTPAQLFQSFQIRSEWNQCQAHIDSSLSRRSHRASIVALASTATTTNSSACHNPSHAHSSSSPSRKRCHDGTTTTAAKSVSSSAFSASSSYISPSTLFTFCDSQCNLDWTWIEPRVINREFVWPSLGITPTTHQASDGFRIVTLQQAIQEHQSHVDLSNKISNWMESACIKLMLESRQTLQMWLWHYIRDDATNLRQAMSNCHLHMTKHSRSTRNGQMVYDSWQIQQLSQNEILLVQKSFMDQASMLLHTVSDILQKHSKSPVTTTTQLPQTPATVVDEVLQNLSACPLTSMLQNIPGVLQQCRTQLNRWMDRQVNANSVSSRIPFHSASSSSSSSSSPTPPPPLRSIGAMLQGLQQHASAEQTFPPPATSSAIPLNQCIEQGQLKLQQEVQDSMTAWFIQNVHEQFQMQCNRWIQSAKLHEKRLEVVMQIYKSCFPTISTTTDTPSNATVIGASETVTTDDDRDTHMKDATEETELHHPCVANLMQWKDHIVAIKTIVLDKSAEALKSCQKDLPALAHLQGVESTHSTRTNGGDDGMNQKEEEEEEKKREHEEKEEEEEKPDEDNDDKMENASHQQEQDQNQPSRQSSEFERIPENMQDRLKQTTSLSTSIWKEVQITLLSKWMVQRDVLLALWLSDMLTHIQQQQQQQQQQSNGNTVPTTTTTSMDHKADTAVHPSLVAYGRHQQQALHDYLHHTCRQDIENLADLSTTLFSTSASTSKFSSPSPSSFASSMSLDANSAIAATSTTQSSSHQTKQLELMQMCIDWSEQFQGVDDFMGDRIHQLFDVICQKHVLCCHCLPFYHPPKKRQHSQDQDHCLFWYHPCTKDNEPSSSSSSNNNNNNKNKTQNQTKRVDSKTPPSVSVPSMAPSHLLYSSKSIEQLITNSMRSEGLLNSTHNSHHQQQQQQEDEEDPKYATIDLALHASELESVRRVLLQEQPPSSTTSSSSSSSFSSKPTARPSHLPFSVSNGLTMDQLHSLLHQAHFCPFDIREMEIVHTLSDSTPMPISRLMMLLDQAWKGPNVFAQLVPEFVRVKQTSHLTLTEFLLWIFHSTVMLSFTSVFDAADQRIVEQLLHSPSSSSANS